MLTLCFTIIKTSVHGLRPVGICFRGTVKDKHSVSLVSRSSSEQRALLNRAKRFRLELHQLIQI